MAPDKEGSAEQPAIKIVAGLGNPGKRYEDTRHNLGFRVLDHLLESDNLSNWRDFGRGEACFSEWSLSMSSGSTNKVLLVKPLTFMNRSGEPLRALLAFYKIEPRELLVVHDELDIEFGRLQLKLGSGAGGHNGIRSVIESLGTQEFVRLRLGIGRPLNPAMQVSDWVLGRFDQAERSDAEALVKRGAAAVRMTLEQGVRAAQNQINRCAEKI